MPLNTQNPISKERSVWTNGKSIGIVIPAYNPSAGDLTALVRKIEQVCGKWNYRLLVVDDGSHPAIDLEAARGSRLHLIAHPENRGKGAALKSGFDYFLKKNPVDLVITLDADWQHPPEKIMALFQAFKQKEFDVVVGSRRRHPAEMPFHRLLSNYLTSLIISLLTGQPVRDSQCGFRLIDSRVLKSLRLRENRFHLESEFLIRAGSLGFKMGFVPIPTIYSNEKSSINHIADTVNFVSLIIQILWERFTLKCIRRSATKWFKNMSSGPGFGIRG